MKTREERHPPKGSPECGNDESAALKRYHLDPGRERSGERGVAVALAEGVPGCESIAVLQRVLDETNALPQVNALLALGVERHLSQYKHASVRTYGEALGERERERNPRLSLCV